MENNTIKTQPMFVQPTWKVWITDSFCVHCKTPPNWFHRKLQYLILGYKWEKMK
jgi:hypothetical protein